MLSRFTAAAAVASVAIALGSLTLVFLVEPGPLAGYRLTRLWCVMPALWGLWALLAPKSWAPERLPAWGAILGVIAGVLALFVVNLPAQVMGVQLSALQRGLAMAFVIAFYYLLWMVVRSACRSLSGQLPAGR